MSWRWMPCVALSATALGFVGVAVLLTPKPDRTVSLSASSADVNLSSVSSNIDPPNDDTSTKTQMMARRGFRSAEPGRPEPARHAFSAPGYPAPGYTGMAPTPYSDATPTQPRNLIARASYGMQRFAEVAKVKVTGESEAVGSSNTLNGSGGTGPVDSHQSTSPGREAAGALSQPLLP